MATIWRAPNYAPLPPGPIRTFLSPDVLPNLILGAFIAAHSQPVGSDNLQDPYNGRPYYHQDFTWSGVTTRGIPPPPPFIQGQLHLNPERKPYQQLELTGTLNTLELAAAPAPFFAVNESPVFRDPKNFDYTTFETVSYLPTPSTGRVQRLPLQTDVYWRARTVPYDFFYNGTIGLPTTPFRQNEWPLFTAAPINTAYQTQGSISNLGIPPKTVLPFQITDQPVPTPRARDAYADSYSSPHILIITPPLAPFKQTEFPLPIRAKDNPQDHIWSGWLTRQPVAPPFQFSDWPTPQPAKIDPQDHQWAGFTTRGIPAAAAIPMPNVIGLDQITAANIVLGLGSQYVSMPLELVYQDSTWPLLPPPRGQVIQQWPLPGTILTGANFILLVLSSGLMNLRQAVSEGVSNPPNTVIGSTQFP